MSASGVAVDSAGNIYLADNGARVRMIGMAGTITTIAGTGSNGHSGDGGPASSTTLWSPYGVVVDAGGDVFVADSVEGAVRM